MVYWMIWMCTIEWQFIKKHGWSILNCRLSLLGGPRSRTFLVKPRGSNLRWLNMIQPSSSSGWHVGLAHFDWSRMCCCWLVRNASVPNFHAPDQMSAEMSTNTLVSIKSSCLILISPWNPHVSWVLSDFIPIKSPLSLVSPHEIPMFDGHLPPELTAPSRPAKALEGRCFPLAACRPSPRKWSSPCNRQDYRYQNLILTKKHRDSMGIPRKVLAEPPEHRI